MRFSVSAPLLLLIPSLGIAQLEAIDISAACLVGSAVATAPPLIGDIINLPLYGSGINLNFCIAFGSPISFAFSIVQIGNIQPDT